MHTLNLGILAHVDAGKTSLTEQLLHTVGVIGQPGRVDDGDTHTDSLDLERRRGITIQSAVVSFTVNDVAVNLIDTPGHPDFIAEVERVLDILDGAVLVVSAVEGVQPQTRLLMRTLRRLATPTIVFINKIDRLGADPDRVEREIAAKLTDTAIAMGTTTGAGTKDATYRPYEPSDPDFDTALWDRLSLNDDELIAQYLAGDTDPARLHVALARQTRAGRAHPVLSGSAVTGAGVPSLIDTATGLLPLKPRCDTPPEGRVFKVERGVDGDRIAYVRMFTGTLRLRERVRLDGDQSHRGDRVTGIELFDDGDSRRATTVAAGRIAKIWGLSRARIGDTFGATTQRDDTLRFRPPTLAAVVSPVRASDRAGVYAALARLADQDPLIGLRRDEARDEITVSLYGDVQKEVIEATLAEQFGVAVTFSQTSTICIERVTGTGTAAEFMRTEPNPFLATVGLRIEPTPVGSGIEYGIAVERGSMPPAFFTAIEQTVHRTLAQGLSGWQVTDCRITLTHNGYAPRQSHSHAIFDKSMSSTAGDFRSLTPLVVMAALHQAGTRVLEPVQRFRLQIPAATMSTLAPVMTGMGAYPHRSVPRGDELVVTGTIPAAKLPELERRLPGVTTGEGLIETEFDHYEPVAGAPPARTRIGPDPLHRTQYLLRVQRKV